MVSVLVLNWNGERFLSECLSSLTSSACPHVEVVLVDNGSTDGSLDLASKEFPAIRIVAHDRNLGFCQGYNLAVPQTRGRFLVFINNDTVAQAGWLPPLIDLLLERPEVGLTTSKLLLFGTHRLHTAGGKLKLWTGAHELWYGQPEESLGNRTIEPFFACGAAMAISRDLFQRLDGFDPEFFAYAEDLEISWRARLLGFKVCCVGASAVQHHHSATLGMFNPWKLRQVTRNQAAAYIHCLSLLNLAHSLPAVLLFGMVKGLGLSVAKLDPRYLGSVLGAFADILRNLRRFRERRRQVQSSRTISDAQALASVEFGLLDSPAEWLRVIRAASIRPR